MNNLGLLAFVLKCSDVLKKNANTKMLEIIMIHITHSKIPSLGRTGKGIKITREIELINNVFM